MNIIESDYRATNGKDYYSAVINKQNKKIQIFKNFSCDAVIRSFLCGHYSKQFNEITSIFKIEFLGDSIDLSRISKKYSKFEII